MSEIKKILIANSTLTIEYKGGVTPPSPINKSCPIWQSCEEPVKYSDKYEFTDQAKENNGFDLCTLTGVYDDIKKDESKHIIPYQLAEAWITSTYKFKGGGILPVDGGLDSCVDAVTVSLGECTQQTAKPSLCGNGGYWQVSNWSQDECSSFNNTGFGKIPCDQCGDINLLNPCCAASAAYYHAYGGDNTGGGCRDKVTLGKADMPKCSIDNMHGPCWGGPLCISGNDDPLHTNPKYNPDPKDPTKVFENPTKIAGWNNSWWYYSLFPGVSPISPFININPPSDPPEWPCTKSSPSCSTDSGKYKYKGYYYNYKGWGSSWVSEEQPQSEPSYIIAQNACKKAIDNLVDKKILQEK